MSPTWRPWKAWKYKDVDPYTHFFDGVRGEGWQSRGRTAEDTILAPDLSEALRGFAAGTSALFGSSEEEITQGFLSRNRLRPAIPAWAGAPLEPGADWLPTVRAEDAPAADSVIVGVIDRAIALGHSSQRNSDGSTRILGAWQQAVDRSLASGFSAMPNQPPFGMALLSPQINEALTKATLAKPAGALDEEAFNHMVGQADFTHIDGHRELSRAFAHGSHVLDAASGVFPEATDPDEVDFRDRVRSLLINLPERDIVGLASRNLTYFVTLGVMWIVMTADRYWHAAHSAGHGGGPKGYPIVINLSFAKKAGRRDGFDELSKVIGLINDVRLTSGLHPIHVTLPAGNDNLDRGNALVRFPSATARNQPCRFLEWRIVPEDQSSNYVEIWFESDDLTAPPEIEVSLIDPDGNESPVDVTRPGRFTGLREGRDASRDVARVYYEVDPHAPADAPPLKRYVLCMVPTLLHHKEGTEAQSGVWTIKMTNTARTPIDATVNVQTDQSDQPGSRRSRLSFLDDPDYERRDPETGRLFDSYNTPKHEGPDRFPSSSVRKNYDERLPPYTEAAPERPSKVRRHGSINALANRMASGAIGPGVAIVGGYRLSDGTPAPYSCTAAGWDGGSEEAMRVGGLLAAYPTDDGVAHTGRLAAGARDGSVRAMQGTSFAVPQLTRQLAQMLLEATRTALDPDILQDIATEAEAAETPPAHYGNFADPEKVGYGRLALPPRTRVERRYQGERKPGP